MSNYKPVIGFDDNLSNHLQNYAPTAYAVSKMRAGRTPKNVAGEVITDANKIFRPGLFYLEAGAQHLTNTDSTLSQDAVYLYMLVQDPDESLHGGHVLDSTTASWHKSVTMKFRQVQYACSGNSTTVTTRCGTRDTAIDSLTSYTVVDTVQKIQEKLGTGTTTGYSYAYVKDIAMWIKYTVSNVATIGFVVDWQPAITWELWKSITGENPVLEITTDMELVPGTRYFSKQNHTVTLPDANTLEYGQKVTIEQWENASTIKTYNTFGGITTTYEMILNPGIIAYNLTDMRIHSDTSIQSEGTLFTKTAGSTWKASKYFVSKLALKKRSTDVKAPERFCIYTVDDNGGISVQRVCYNDVVTPYDVALFYSVTGDSLAAVGKVYYIKQIIEGIDYYTPDTSLEPGDAIPLSPVHYEASPTAHWYDAKGYTPESINVDEITTQLGGRTYTSFTIKDVDGNLCGAGEYTFAVSQDYQQSDRKLWILERCSDIEAFASALANKLGDTVSDHTDQIDYALEHISNAEVNIDTMKKRYDCKEKYFRLLDNASIMGDNAKKTGETLITYDDNKYIDPKLITSSSYIVECFLARYIPVYQCPKYNTNVRLVYLPTRAESMIGKTVSFILEPGAKIAVYDDCSTTHYDPYEFTGVEDAVGTIPYLTRIDFTLELYRDSTGTDQLVWIYNRSITNTNASITTRDIQEAITAHNSSATSHSGVLASASDLTTHIASTKHITEEERALWNAGAGSAVTETKVAEMIATHNDAAASHSDKVTNTSLATTLTAYVKEADLHDKVVAILDEELTTREW